MNRKTRWLKKFGFITVHIRKERKLSPDEKVRQYTVNVFSQLTEHQYVDHHWFIDLKFESLKKLYYELFEIWSYRLPMQKSYKEEMVKNGQLFNNWKNVDRYESSMNRKLRLEILKNIERLVTEGKTEDHRKSGCHIFMLGFVLVSEDAATSCPHLFQAAYIDDE